MEHDIPRKDLEPIKEHEKAAEKVKPTWFRVLVVVILLTALSMCVKQTHGLILLYLSDPIVTQIKMTMNDVMEFPAVTVCNMNPVRRSRWEKRIKEIELNEAKQLSLGIGMHNRTKRRTIRDFAPNDTNVTVHDKLEKILKRLALFPRHLSGKTRLKRSDSGLMSAIAEVESAAKRNKANIASLDGRTKNLIPNDNRMNIKLDKVRSDISELWSAINASSDSFASLNATFEDLETRISAVELTTTKFFEEMEKTKSYLKFLQANITRIVDHETKNETSPKGDGVKEKQLPPSKDMEAFNDYLKDIGKMKRNDIHIVGHQKEDFIAICSWQGSICNPSHFSVFQDVIYGNCFTFNTSQVDPNVRGTGPRNGLSLSLYIEQNEYIDRVAPAAGARIVIHDFNQKPFPEDEGFSVAPGYTSAVFLRKSTTETVEPMCDPEVQASYEHSGYNYEYSQKACLKQCLSDEILRQCHCAGRQFLLDTNHSCSPEYKEEEQCVQRLENLAQKKQLLCSCAASCRATTYSPMISSAIWPADKYFPSFLEELVRVRHKVLDLLGNVTDISKYFRKHFLRVDIFFQELTEQDIIQRHSYGVESLLSDIGGQLGLWVGVSVSTLYQSLETIYLVAMSIFMWLQAKRLVKRALPRIETPEQEEEEVVV